MLVPPLACRPCVWVLDLNELQCEIWQVALLRAYPPNQSAFITIMVHFWIGGGRFGRDVYRAALESTIPVVDSLSVPSMPKGVFVRYFRRLALPIGFIALGIMTLSATAAPPLGNDVANYADIGAARPTASAAKSTLVPASSSSLNETVNYTYDELGRLVSVKQEGSVNNGVVSNYSLDKAGNRTNVKVTGVP